MVKLTLEHINKIIKPFKDKGFIDDVIITSDDHFEYKVKIDDEFCLFFLGAIDFSGFYGTFLCRHNDLNFKNSLSRAIKLEKTKTPEDVERFIKNFSGLENKIRRILDKKVHLCNIIDYTRDVLYEEVDLNNEDVFDKRIVDLIKQIKEWL